LPLSREAKENKVAEYVDLLENSNGLFFTEFRGLSNKQMGTLRRSIREANGTYQVTKLTLLRLAMEQAGYEVPESLDDVPIAVGFALEEVPSVAKALTDYADDNELLVIRGGMIGSSMLSAKQVEALASLPPLDVLRAQIIGMLDAPAANLVGVIQAGVAQVVNVLSAYADQAGDGAEAAPAPAE
jgi:large subunit ribosomal protein L10